MFLSYKEPSGKIITNNYIADENGFRSSLASSNGPLLPVVGKLPATATVALPGKLLSQRERERGREKLHLNL